MFPNLFSQETASGTLEYHTWGMMLMLAFMASGIVAHRRAGRVGIDPNAIFLVVIISIVSALLGSRLLHFVMAEPDRFFSNPLVFFNCREGGMAFYGGVIAAVLAGVILARVKGIVTLKLMDVVAPCIMLGLCIGRLGCFAAGCCHGRVCDLPVVSSLTGGLFPGGEAVTVEGFPHMALVFHRGVGVGSLHDIPTFPTQLWESAGAFVLFLFLSWVWWSWRKFDGLVLGLLMLLYPLLRSSIETFRGDSIRGTEYFGLLSTSQLVSIPVFLIAVTILIYGWKTGLAEETPFQPPVDDEILDLV